MLYHRIPSRLNHRILPLLQALIILALLSSCQTIEKVTQTDGAAELNRTEDQFNDAVMKEYALRHDPPSSEAEAMATKKHIDSTFSATQAIATSLIDSKKEQLAEQNLLGRAYRLKAFSEWKTGSSANAMNTIEAANLANVSFLPTDQVLMRALPSMMDIDKAVQFMGEKSQTFDTVFNLFKNSILALNAVTGSNPEIDEPRLQLLMTQLGAMKNWDQLNTLPPARHVTDNPPLHVLEAAEKTWCDDALKGIWKNFETEVARLDTGDACEVFDGYSRLLSPQSCEGLVVQKPACSNQ